MTASGAQGAEDIETLRSAREAYVDHWRVHGETPAGPAKALEARLRKASRRASPENRAVLLYELASLLHFTDRYDEAIRTYDAAITDAAGRGDVAFLSWIGIARAHANGKRDHGAAERALQRAIEAAGAEPSRRQRFEIARNSSEFQSGRGELESALVNALQANRLADTDAERYYAQFDAGEVLWKFVGSCDYRKLVDAKTAKDGGDGWAACHRAVAAAQSKFAAASETAERLGWRFLRAPAKTFIDLLELQLDQVNRRALVEKAMINPFNAEDSAHVLVNENFVLDASKLRDADRALIEAAMALTGAHAGAESARGAYALGLSAYAAGNEGASLAYFEKAVGFLEKERSTLLDLRKRGTLVENRAELVRDLALKLLSHRRYDGAFAAFESFRARGLGELSAAFEANELSDAERRGLADVVELESRESAILTWLVETTIAGTEHGRSVEKLQDLDAVRARHSKLLDEPAFASTVARVASAERDMVKLAELRTLAKETGIPVLLYWVTFSDVVVWVIAPDGMEVKTVVLPEVAVVDKVGRVMDSIKTPDQPFDAAAARQLHTYLIQPFMHHLTGDEVIIVPQGPLVALPFEALIDARTGAFLAEKFAVSYAPSATFAAKAMHRTPIAMTSATAIYDNKIEIITHEIERIARTPAVQVTAHESRDLSAKKLTALLGGAKTIHVLLHGVFDDDDPLQSWIDLNNPALSSDENKVTAAELLATDWRGARIAVFSSCEGARMNVRISNEIYGLSWAPLVGGAHAVMMSRLRVLAESNADWMAGFYGALAAGSRSPAVAAAKAMRGMIGSSRAHPFYWAGPQVFGR